MKALFASLWAKKKKAFGIPLDSAVNASPTNDNLPLPLSRGFQRIEKKALDLEGIYRVTGIMRNVEDLIKLYDTGADPNLENYDAFVVTSMIKKYFVQLPDPLLTFDLHEKFLTAARNKPRPAKVKAIKAVMDQLPKTNKTVLQLLVQHLKRVAEREKENKMSVNNLAIVFGPTVFRSRDDNAIRILTDSPLFLQCVQSFINDYEYYFNDVPDPTLENGAAEPAGAQKNFVDNVTAANSIVNDQWQQMKRSRQTKRQESTNRRSTKVQDLLGDSQEDGAENLRSRMKNMSLDDDRPSASPKGDFASLPAFDVETVARLADTLIKEANGNFDRSEVLLEEPATQSNWKRMSTEADSSPVIVAPTHSAEDEEMAAFANQGASSKKKPVENEEEFNKKLDSIVVNVENPFAGMLARINLTREREGRVEDYLRYTPAELEAEKKMLKRELRNFEKKFEKEKGREPEKSEKESLRPIYSRYKAVRQHVSQVPQNPSDYEMQTPRGENFISPNSPLYDIVASPELKNSTAKSTLRKSVNLAKKNLHTAVEESNSQLGATTGGSLTTAYTRKSIGSGNKRNSSYSENVEVVSRLMNDEQFNKLRKAKKEVLVKLHDFENEFKEKNDRKVKGSADKKPMEKEYEQYAEIKKQMQDIISRYEKELTN